MKIRDFFLVVSVGNSGYLSVVGSGSSPYITLSPTGTIYSLWLHFTQFPTIDQWPHCCGNEALLWTLHSLTGPAHFQRVTCPLSQQFHLFPQLNTANNVLQPSFKLTTRKHWTTRKHGITQHQKCWSFLLFSKHHCLASLTRSFPLGKKDHLGCHPGSARITKHVSQETAVWVVLFFWLPIVSLLFSFSMPTLVLYLDPKLSWVPSPHRLGQALLLSLTGNKENLHWRKTFQIQLSYSNIPIF